MNHSEFKASVLPRLAPVKCTCKQGTIGLSFTFYWLRKWCEFLSTNDGVLIQKTSNLGAEIERFFVFGNLNLKSSQEVLNLPVIVFQ